MEKEIELFKETLSKEIVKLVNNFIKIKKNSLKDRENKPVKKQVRELKKQLKEKGLSEEKMDELTRYCENLVDLEQQQTEKGQLQAKVEVPTNN